LLPSGDPRKGNSYQLNKHRLCHGLCFRNDYYRLLNPGPFQFNPNTYFGLLTGLSMVSALIAVLALLPQPITLIKSLGPERITQDPQQPT